MPEERVSVLVVAGDAALSQTIRTTLSVTGFVLEDVANSVEAVARVLRSSYELVLVGLGEKSFDGFEICSQLRTVSPNLGIVLISRRGGLQDEIRALEAGADDCVSVPFRFREVVGRLRAVLRRPEPGGGAVGTILRAGD